MNRANPFDDLSDFAPGQPAKPVESAAIEQIARTNGFPSRQPVATAATRPRRRYTTGRNQQLNLKATAETVARFYRLADDRDATLGELLEQALDALERCTAPNNRTAAD